jgi:hypothetical protein
MSNQALVTLVFADGSAVSFGAETAEHKSIYGKEWLWREGRAFVRYGHATQFCGVAGEEEHALVYVERPRELLEEVIWEADRMLRVAVRRREQLPTWKEKA